MTLIQRTRRWCTRSIGPCTSRRIADNITNKVDDAGSDSLRARETAPTNTARPYDHTGRFVGDRPRSSATRVIRYRDTMSATNPTTAPSAANTATNDGRLLLYEFDQRSERALGMDEGDGGSPRSGSWNGIDWCRTCCHHRCKCRRTVLHAVSNVV